MPPAPHDIRKSFLEKAKRHMADGKWPELMLAMDAVILTKKGDDISTKREVLVAHRMRAHALSRMTRFSEAVADYQEAMDISKAVDDKSEEAMCLEGLGRVSWHMGETGMAMDFLKSALALSRESNNADTEGQVMISLAFIDKAEGNLEKAVDGLEKAIEMLSPLGPSEQLARAHYEIGDALIKLGRIDEAFMFLEVALDVAQKVGNLASMGFARTYFAICYARKGDFKRALEDIDKAVLDLGKSHDLVGLVEATSVHGMICYLGGKPDQALQELTKAESIAMKNGLDAAKSEVLVLKAEVLVSKGENVSAKIAYTEAIGIQKRLGNTKWADELGKRMAKLAKGK